ncbi:hypothetical protein [Portibacter marinus]|uniref:hypothetical protein n=1 Tax=Portibacter marinus TaxID=2898660 RepID=UPI001F1D3C88|nr:hypothetical protein [Portibacter marinus]
MLKRSPITRFVVLFLAIFISLIVIFSITKVRAVHCSYYSAVAAPLFNIINPHVFAEFSPGGHETNPNWDIEFKVWDKREHGRELFVRSYRSRNNPKALLYQNHHEIIIIPFIFIIALMLASPMDWKNKLWRTPLAIFIFYLFMTFYLSYRFEYTINRNELPMDSIWHVLISFFGLGGNTDPIYIFVFLLCCILIVPYVINKKGLLSKL